MALSKKQAKVIANLINDCSVWNNTVTSMLARTDSPEYSSKLVRQGMAYHDESAQKLNDILGTQAVTLYNCI